MKGHVIKEKVLFIMPLSALLSAGVFGYKFFKNPDSIFDLLFVLSGIFLSIMTNLWCTVWGTKKSEDGKGDFLESNVLANNDPHYDMGTDPLISTIPMTNLYWNIESISRV